MITRSECMRAQHRAAQLLGQTGVSLREEELARIAVVDFGLGELEQTGAQILSLLDTDEVAVKLIALFPSQTLPQHRHPPLGAYPGKMETLRCEWGELILCTEGAPVALPLGHPPAHRLHTYTVWNACVLRPGMQMTLAPNTWHWFQVGPEGAVVWSWSTRAVDVEDQFVDPEIVRQTVIAEDGVG